MPSASSFFLPVFGFRKVTQKSSSEKSEKILEILFHQKSPGARRADPSEARKAQSDPQARVRGGHAQGRCPTLGYRLAPPIFPIYIFVEKPPKEESFSRKKSRGAATIKP